jgi:putative tryptophan/tyrosine transport system substrate-binding protein
VSPNVQRREFITLVGGAAAAWPLAGRAQQGERMRRIGVLMAIAADDPQSQRRMTAFVQGLQELGWTDGRNIRIDTRWTAGDTDRMRKQAAELVGWRRTSSWPLAARSWGRCSRRPAPRPSCSR